MKIIHCSYHKCLTVYYSSVMGKVFGAPSMDGKGYKHFNSLVGDFYNNVTNLQGASVNNHCLDLERLGDNFKISRFIRDPRDLVVSGYFYHKRGAEQWCNINNPTELDYKVVNGAIPPCLNGGAYSEYLSSVSEEDGLIAEIDFRQKHFESMRHWPEDDLRIRVFKYEDMIGNEWNTFRELFRFYGLNVFQTALGLFFMDRYSAKKQQGKRRHIRNVKSKQWREYFTPKVEEYFNSKYSDVLKRYNYS